MLSRNPAIQIPATLGGDFSGVIQDIAPGVSNFKTGKPVYGLATVLNGTSGSSAELVATSGSSLAIKPRAWGHLERGSMPLAGVSALQALAKHIQFKRG